MRRFLLALTAGLALAVAACAPGAEQPVRPQPPGQGGPADPGSQPGTEPGASPDVMPSPDDAGDDDGDDGDY